MRILTLSLILFFSIVQRSNAQFSFGLTGGLSTTDFGDEQVPITLDELAMYKIKAQEARYGIHLGGFAIVQIGNIFLMPEAIFNSTATDYEIEYLDQPQNVILEEEFKNLDLGMMIGWKYGILRLGAGPVAHYKISHRSELWEISGYDEKLDDMKWAWQAGLGLDIVFVHLDLRYEGNFSKQSDHITFFDESFEFDNSPKRWILRLGISF